MKYLILRKSSGGTADYIRTYVAIYSADNKAERDRALAEVKRFNPVAKYIAAEEEK